MFKQEYLCHYGILGMKWGIRRYQNKDGTLTAKGKKHKKLKVGTSKDYKRTKAIQAKSIKQMSNAELKEVTERMRLVNEFQNQARQSLRNGKHWVNATLDKTAGVYVNTLLNSQVKTVKDFGENLPENTVNIAKKQGKKVTTKISEEITKPRTIYNPNIWSPNGSLGYNSKYMTRVSSGGGVTPSGDRKFYWPSEDVKRHNMYR